MEEALHDVPLFRAFASLGWDRRLPDESIILRFRHVLEKHKLADRFLALVNDLLGSQGLLLKAGTVVDAKLIAAPSSTKNKDGQHDPEMSQSKQGNQKLVDMKAINVRPLRGQRTVLSATVQPLSDSPGGPFFGIEHGRGFPPISRALQSVQKMGKVHGTD